MVAGADYPDWTEPQAHADAIAATGAPLLTLVNGLTNNIFQPVAGGTDTVPNFLFTQPGYEVFLSAFQIVGGAAGPLEIRMSWFDETGVWFIDEQVYWIWPGITSLSHELVGRGPVSGSILSMQFINHSTVAQYQINLNLFQRSHLYTRHDWRTISYTQTSSGGVLPVMDPLSQLICFRNVTIGAGLVDLVELPLYTGMVQVAGNTGSGTTDLTIQIRDSADINAEGIGNPFYIAKSDASGNFAFTLPLPRYQCQFRMTNGNAAGRVCNGWIHTIE